MHTFEMAAVRPRGVGLTVLIVASLFAAELRAQCLPPLANYSLHLEVSPNPVESCPGNTFKVAVFAEVTPGTVEISGFGLNLEFITDVPVTIISVNPRAIGPPGGFFGSNVVGQEVAIIGGDLQGRSFKTPLVLAELLVEVGIVSAPTTWTIDFTGTASLRGGFVPLNHLVEGSTGCDVLPPLLGLRKGTVIVKTCSENFIRGDCNNNGRIRGLLGDPLFILHFLFTGGPAPSCDRACDSNHDDTIDVSDALYLINWMTGIGTPPPAPFPLCGPSPVATPLTCVVHLCP